MSSLSCVTLRYRSPSDKIWLDDSEAQSIHCRDQGEVRGWIWSEGIGGDKFSPDFCSVWVKNALEDTEVWYR